MDEAVCKLFGSAAVQVKKLQDLVESLEARGFSLDQVKQEDLTGYWSYLTPEDFKSLLGILKAMNDAADKADPNRKTLKKFQPLPTVN